jgi:hypothetical protein
MTLADRRNFLLLPFYFLLPRFGIGRNAALYNGSYPHVLNENRHNCRQHFRRKRLCGNN